jgi:hypothetical protein
VSHSNNGRTTDEDTGDAISVFYADLETSIDAVVEAGVWEDGSPSGSAMLVVTRGPNRIAVPAGSAGHIRRAASRQRHLPR